MYTKKLIFICYSLMLSLSLMASHSGGKYYGNCQRALSKKYQYVGPDQSYRKKQGLYERMMAKKMAPVQEATHALASTMFKHYELPVADLPSMHEHQTASCHLYRSGNAHPVLTFAVLSLLLLAPHAYAAQVEQVPQVDAYQQLAPVFTLGQQIRYMQAKDAATLASLTLDGHIQPVADHLDGFADTIQTFASEHDGLADVVIPGAIISLKSLYGAIIGAAKTNTFAGAGAYAAIAAIRAGIDEAKGVAAHELLGDIINQVVQHGVENLAPKLMKLDNTLKQESAERLATWIAAGVLLNGYEFKHFAKHMRAVDFKGLRVRAYLLAKAKTKVTFSELMRKSLKSVFSGTPGATTEILIRSALLEFHDIPVSVNAFQPVSGNAFQQVAANAGQYMAAGTQTSGVAGNAFQQVVANAGQYMATDIPTSGVPGNAFQQLIENAGLFPQSHIPTSNYAGNGYSGNAIQQLIHDAGLYLQYNRPSNNPMGNYGGNGYSSGNAYQSFMQNPGSSFHGGNSGGGVPGNAFSQMASSTAQYFGGSGSKRH